MLQSSVHGAKQLCMRLAPTLLALATLASAAPRMAASTIFFSGNLRTDATVTSCGAGCTLDNSNSDFDYAQFAAVVDSFTVTSTTMMSAVSYSFGGGTSRSGHTVAAGGLEPYLSLFDSSGNFLASTYFGITCPDGASSYDGHCYDVALIGGTLSPGTYYIALTAYANMSFAENYGAGNLSDGFTGLGNLALDEDLHYAFDVILPSNSTPPPPIPEPNYVFLAGLALVAPFFLRRMRLRAGMQA